MKSSEDTWRGRVGWHRDPVATLAIGVGLIAAGLLVACSGDSGGRALRPDATTVVGSGRPATAADLDGARFAITAISKGGVEQSIVPATSGLVVTFGTLPSEDHRTPGPMIAIADGCNALTAGYFLDASGRLTVREEGSTFADCVTAIKAQALSIDTTFSDGAVLTINGQAMEAVQGTTEIELERQSGSSPAPSRVPATPAEK